MAAQAAERLWSAEEFLVWESAQSYKHELIDNRVHAVRGASRSHNRINLNLAFVLNNRLRGLSQCHARKWILKRPILIPT